MGIGSPRAAGESPGNVAVESKRVPVKGAGRQESADNAGERGPLAWQSGLVWAHAACACFGASSCGRELRSEGSSNQEESNLGICCETLPTAGATPLSIGIKCK